MTPAIRDTSNLKLASARCGILPSKYACIIASSQASQRSFFMAASPSQTSKPNQVHGGARGRNPPLPRFSQYA